MSEISFTLVSTTLNEMGSLGQTIGNLEAQTRLPDEIVIVDGGSKDGTYERLQQWSNDSSLVIRVLRQPGCNVAEGRNQAIQMASYNYIASTDFGCVHEPGWLKSIITPFEEEHNLEVVGGAFTIDEKSAQTLPAKADYILSNGYKVAMDEHYTVTSRSIAYKKEVWEQLGGYPEWLTLAADDSTFWKQIKKHYFRYRLIPEANVKWRRHETLTGFLKEAGRYGLGDGESETNFRNFWSHIVETTLRYSLFINLLLVPLWIKTGVTWTYLLFILQLFGLRSYWRAFKSWLKLRSGKYHFGVLLYAFYMIERLRISYLKAYSKGYLFKDKEKKTGASKLKLSLTKG
jgi:glycosyltransferase involved in cell wall biosynthesis